MVGAIQWQKLILLEVGAGLDSQDPISARAMDTVTPLIQTLWACWAEKGLVFPRLQYLYTKRQCLQLLLGQMRELVPVTVQGLNLNIDKKLGNLNDLLKTVDEQIVAVEKTAAASRPPAIAALQQTSPIMPLPLQPNPNARVLRGDAIFGNWNTNRLSPET